MKTSNRDILVLAGKNKLGEQNLEQHLQMLNELLTHVESRDAFCKVYEVLHLGKHKVYQQKSIVWKVACAYHQKPFVFMNNKN